MFFNRHLIMVKQSDIAVGIIKFIKLLNITRTVAISISPYEYSTNFDIQIHQ